MKKIPQLKIDIRNQSEDVAVIDIDGEIGWWNENGELNSAPRIKQKLKDIAKLDVSKIVVNINSLGGFVDDGLAIHDALASHDAEIETHVTGMTASAATIIAQAGDKRFMSDNALYLIHKAWGLAIGNASDMLAAAEDLETIDSRITNIYTKRSGKSEAEINELMNANGGAGKWIDADEALEAGLIDEAFEPMKAAAAVDMATFRNMGLPEPDEDKIKTDKDGNRTVNVPVNIQLMVNGKDYEGSIDDLRKEFEQVNQVTIKENANKADKEVPEGMTLEQAREREIETIIED